MEKSEKIYTFRIPTPLLESLHVIAEAQDLRINQLMRKVLKEFVAQQSQQSQQGVSK